VAAVLHHRLLTTYGRTRWTVGGVTPNPTSTPTPTSAQRPRPGKRPRLPR
jgi:hypothetical protein